MEVNRSFLFDEPLPLDKLHGFLLAPTDLDEKSFHRLLFMTGISLVPSRFMHRVVCDEVCEFGAFPPFDPVFEAFIRVGFFESNGDIRRMIKNNGIFLGNQPLKEGVTFPMVSQWKDSGVGDSLEKLKFCVARKGKKDFELFFAWFKD